VRFLILSVEGAEEAQ